MHQNRLEDIKADFLATPLEFVIHSRGVGQVICSSNQFPGATGLDQPFFLVLGLEFRAF
jgi:hypothetical protein